MFKVAIRSMNAPLFEGTAETVILPSEEGELSIMAFHCPIICRLDKGYIWVDKKRMYVRRGVAKMQNNELNVLVEV